MTLKLFAYLIKYKLNLLALSIFLAASSLITAQENYVFENYSIPQGLSNPTINCIYEDKYGFLWLGTNDGLSRYDGYEFKVFKNNSSDSSSLPANSITSISEDLNGNLWIGGANVLVKYNRVNNSFIEVAFDREQNLNQPLIEDILIDQKNRIWVSTDFFGIHLIDQEKMTTKRKKFILNGNELVNGDIHSMIETSDKEILAVDIGAGVFYYNENSDEFYLYSNLGTEAVGSASQVLFEDEFDRLWIGGARSLSIYNRKSKSIEKIKIFSNNTSAYYSNGAINIIKDKSGFIWIATLDRGLFRYNPVDNKFFHFTDGSKNSFKSIRVLSLLQDSFGNVWIGTALNGLYKVDPNKQPMNILSIPEKFRSNTIADGITAIAKDNNGNIAIGTNGLGVIWENVKTGKVKNFKADKTKEAILSNVIRTLTVDKNNNLWIGSDLGLNKLNPENGKVQKYFTDLPNKYRIFSVNDLKFDNAGRLFVAHAGGVDILYPNQNYIKGIPSVNKREYSEELLSEIIELSNSSEPVASILKVGEQKSLEKEFELKKDTKILAIGVGEGQPNLEIMFDYGWLEDEYGNIVWGMDKFFDSFHFQGGMKNRIVAKTIELKKGKYKLKYQSDVGHSYADFNVVAPKDSSMWGIQLIRLNDKQFAHLSEIIEDEIKNGTKMLMDDAQSISISKSYENILWIGTLSQGLIKYNLSDNNFSQYNKIIKSSASDFVISNDVYFVMEDSKGYVWFSSPKGLGKLNPKTEEINYFTEKDGLPTNLIRTIQEDNYGNLWISSAAGLTTLVRNTEGKKETFINIDIKDGLQGYSYSRATWKTDTGELYFGGINGINYFRPGRTNRTKPKIVITDFRLADVSIYKTPSNTLLKKGLNEIEELELNYKQNDIAFRFSPIHYSRPERNLIAYKLEGFNKDWVYSKLHFASFTNLDPGEYTFKLKAANGDGIWSDEEKSIHIEVLPPYWRTTFAYIGYGIFLVLMFFSVDRFQRKRLIRKAREKMKIQEAEHRAQAAELQTKAAEAQSKLIQIDNERKTQELEEARKLQLSMLPKELPNLPNLDIAVYMQTATEVGGDYYDFRVESDGTLNAALGDATGHGMQAGTLVTIMKGIFTTEAEKNDVLSFFDKSNRALKEINLDRLMMAFAFLKIKDNRLTLANAGIPPVYIYRSKTKELEKIDNKGMPLGAMKNFPYKETKAELHTGDVIFLLSDGFPELFNERQEIFGYERVEKTFLEVADRSSEKIIEHLKESAIDWTGGNAPDDDVTFVVIKVK